MSGASGGARGRGEKETWGALRAGWKAAGLTGYADSWHHPTTPMEAGCLEAQEPAVSASCLGDSGVHQDWGTTLEMAGIYLGSLPSSLPVTLWSTRASLEPQL